MSYMAPLAMILAFRAVEDLVSEFRIKKRDQLLNRKVYWKKGELGKWEEVKAEDIKVGDVIKINDERVPADVLILSARFFNKQRKRLYQN